MHSKKIRFHCLERGLAAGSKKLKEAGGDATLASEAGNGERTPALLQCERAGGTLRDRVVLPPAPVHGSLQEAPRGYICPCLGLSKSSISRDNWFLSDRLIPTKPRCTAQNAVC